jgi:predicted Zn finger-like uncharacterized protein
MIVQCPKCETQYRFDDGLIEGDGAWVRCTRCQNVFFQSRLPDLKLGESPEISSVRISDSKRVQNDGSHPENGNLGKTGTGEEILQSRPFPGQLPEGKEPVVDFEKELLSVAPDRDRDNDDLLSTPTELAKEEQPLKHDRKPPQKQKKRRRWGRVILVSITLLAFISIIAAAVVWALFPDVRDSLLKNASPCLRGIPALEGILPVEKADGKVNFEAVKIKDLRERIVTNIITGNLHVIEGVAFNQASYPVSEIKVRLVITDPNDAVVGQKVVYCGNTLTDEELGSMTEAEIQRELSIPEGSDFPGRRILPNGKIPFMIAFTQDQTTGTIKTFVTIAGADRTQ